MVKGAINNIMDISKLTLQLLKMESLEDGFKRGKDVFGGYIS